MPQKLFLVFVAAYIGLFFLLFPDRASELHKHWITPGDIDMGYFLLCLFIFCGTRNLRVLSDISPNPLFLAPTIVLSMGLYLSQTLDIKTAFYALQIMLIISLFNLSLGSLGLKRILLPLAVLSMAMPYWYLAIQPLQHLSALMVGKFISAISLTAFIEDTYITLPTGTIHIAGGCSGIKYALSAITLSLMSADWHGRTMKQTLISTIQILILAVLANWIRITILVFIAYYDGIDNPLLADHDNLGWIIFVLALAPWYWIEFKRNNAIKGIMPDPITNITTQCKPAQKSIILFVTASIVVATPQAHVLLTKTNNKVTSTPYIIKPRIGEAIVVSAQPRDWHLSYPTALRSLYTRYQFANIIADIAVLDYYNFGDQELANTTNDLLDESWLIKSDITWANKNQSLRIAYAKKETEKRVIYYWYNHGRTTANTILSSKWEMFKSNISGIHYSQLFAISIQCAINCKSYLTPSDKILEFIEGLKTAYKS